MNALFGISMDTIMAVTLGLSLAITAVLVVLGLRNRLFVKLGLRNIPRRRAQTLLIVFGLMLSSVIVTSAFSTGDTISYSIRAVAVKGLGAIDELVSARAARSVSGPAYIAGTTVDRARAAAPNVAGVMGVMLQSAPLQDATSRQTKASTVLVGLPATYPAAFGPLTTVAGATVTLGQLGPGEVYLSELTPHAVSAAQGDRITLYIDNRPAQFTVRRVLQAAGLAAGGLNQRATVEVLMPLDRLQALVGQPGAVTTVLLSNNGDVLSGAGASAGVTRGLRVALANPSQVAAAKALLAAPAGQAALRTLVGDKTLPAAIHTKLVSLRAEVQRGGVSSTLTDLLSDPDVSGALTTVKDPRLAGTLGPTLSTISDFTVQPIKQRALDVADLAGSFLTTIFLVFGLFSIAAGIMLIFLIFVMLAAERRAEMGMSRAVGTKRRHLVQQFLFEGYVYDLGAALVGVILGIAVGLSMVAVMAGLFQSNTFFTLQRHVEPRSVVVAFCLGALVTFFTVLVSSWRVSRLNVVAAIRDLPDDLHLDRSIAAAFRRPLADLAQAGRRLRRGRIFGALAALLAAPWHLVLAFGVFISRGPLLIAGGYLLVQWGVGIKQLFPFNLGISFGLIGAALLVRWILGAAGVSEHLRNRLGFSLAGVALVVFWLLPFDAFRSDLQFDIEMFFLSGLMLMLGGIWAVMYNVDLLLNAVLRVFGNVGRLGAVLRMAVAYPMQHRFRTGMTLFMFSLIIFALVVMAVLTGSFGTPTINLNKQYGGYDAWGNVNPLNPIANITADIHANGTLRTRIAAAGGLAQLGVTAREAGSKDGTWHDAAANVADDGYLASTRWTLHSRAAGYASDAQVWQALRTHPGYAVVDGSAVRTKSQGGGDAYITSFYYETKGFQPAQVEVRDPRTGVVLKLTVIGVLDNTANAFGIFTGQNTLAAAHDAPAAASVFYFRVAPGQDVHQAVVALGAAFLTHGLDLTESQVDFDKSQALGTGLFSLLEGFMALGLVVGIAALGVIATRAVVERRQQIGMLRAIGFKRRMVQATFLLESSFVALLATALGTVLGLLLARQLVLNFAKTSSDLQVVVPWSLVAIIIVGSYVAALATTYLPAWQASRVAPAEALRYE